MSQIISGTQMNTNGWALLGNAGTVQATNFLGTTDNIGLSFRTNNIIRSTITSAGDFGIGTTTPIATFNVNGGFASSHVNANALPVTLTNANHSVMINGALSGVINIPAAAGNTGLEYYIWYNYSQANSVAATATVTPAGGNILNPATNVSAATLTMSPGGVRAVLLRSDGTNWHPYMWDSGISATSVAWGLLGNAGTVQANNFLGTTDNIGLSFRTNNAIRQTIDNAGKVGIGTIVPNALLHMSGVNGNNGTSAALMRLTDTTSGSELILDNAANANNIRLVATFTTGNSFELQAAGNSNQLVLNKTAGGVGFGVALPLNRIHVGRPIVANTGGIRLPITSASANVAGGAIGVDVNGDIVKIAGSASPTVNAQVGTAYKTTAADSNNIVTLNNAAAITVTLSNLTVGSSTTFIQKGVGVVTFISGTLTRRHVANLFSIAGQNGVVSVVVDGSDGTLSGDLA